MKKFDKRKYEKEFINKYEAKNEYNKAKEQLIFTSNQQFNYKKVPRKRRIILISSILLLASIITFLSIILNLPKANNSLTYLKMEVVETNLKNNINPNILANIEGLLPEKEENELKYFAKPNSKILIAIYLNNPNNYEILSFSINDYKYQSYEFKDGSTGQIIYIEVPIGSISGIEEFYINSLKYIDDKEIKEAIYEGERTIEVGITYINLPKIVDVKLDVEETKCNISYNLVNNSIINSDTYYKAFIFKNNNLIAGIDLNINDNNININNLEMATSYNLIIGYAYDLFDSLGYRFIVLYNCSFTTKNGIFNVVANSSYNSVNIQYDKNNDVNVKGAKLYYKNELINEISGENISFNNLLANSEYDLIIYYSYVLNEKEISNEYKISFKTNSYEKPIIEAAILNVLGNVNWVVEITSGNELVVGQKILLYEDNLLVCESEDLIGQYNAKENKNYYIEVYIYYDLLDGLGIREIKETYNAR